MVKRFLAGNIAAALLLLCLPACQRNGAPVWTASSAPVATHDSPAASSATIAPTHAPSAQPTLASEEQEGLVLAIVDGDTIDVAVDGDVYRVRYLGVDTPEKGQKSYLIAKDLNRSLVYMLSAARARCQRQRSIW